MWTDRVKWEEDVRYNQQREREVYAPYSEMRRWRRRAIGGWLAALGLGLALLLIAGK